MNAQCLSGLVVVCAAGSAVAGGQTPTKVDYAMGQVKHVAHIYFNVATGEKVTTLLDTGDAQHPVDGVASREIWTQTTGAMCADFGDTEVFFYELDDSSDPESLHNFIFDWGDIAMDTVVDMVQIHWVTNHADVDLVDTQGNPGPDGVGDGVVGFAGAWTFMDAMNGRAPAFDCLAYPLCTIQMYNLPGEVSDPGDDSVAFYTVDVDLGASGYFGTLATFEIGDTDSDLQGAAFHTPNLDERFSTLPGVPDIDLDLDGLADWGWSVIFDQPGTVDVDNADGDSDRRTGVDGDVLALATAGVMFGAPTPGHPEFDSVEETWRWVSDGPTAGVTEDLFNTAHLDGSSIIMDGPWFFGGLDCTPDEAGYTPAAMFQVVLYGPGDGLCCPTDLNCDGFLDFFDLSMFVNGELDYNGDTVFDFFDIAAFIADFSAGCP